MPQGTLALSVFGVIFLGLQVYWIGQTLKGLKTNETIDKSFTQQLEEKKKQLEKLLKK